MMCSTSRSETYYSEFTAFAGVPQITYNVPLLRSTPDVHEYPTMFPVTIVREDCGVLLLLKRSTDGYHRIISGRLLSVSIRTCAAGVVQQ